jgi:hypothetical protein
MLAFFVVCCFEPVSVEFVVGKIIIGEFMIGILEYTTISITIIIRNFIFFD